MSPSFKQKNIENNCIYLIYDGECLLCSHFSKALKLKKAVGKLVIIDARTEHPLVTEVMKKGFDLNDSVFIKYNDTLYHGTDAVHLLALLSSPIDVFNRLNGYLFKYKATTILFYPIFKALRYIILLLRGIPKIHKKSEEPVFANVFGESWNDMPEILKIIYGNHAYNDQHITIEGKMNIYFSRFFFASPLYYALLEL